MWYIGTMKYYSVVQRNEIGSFVEMWMDLKSIIQREVRIGILLDRFRGAIIDER